MPITTKSSRDVFTTFPLVSDGTCETRSWRFNAVRVIICFEPEKSLSFARRLVGTSVSIRVVTSLENDTGDHCVDVFVRADGTFGFEEYRRDHEDGRGWFPLARYSHQVFATAEDALAQAKSEVAWLAVDRA